MALKGFVIAGFLFFTMATEAQNWCYPGACWRMDRAKQSAGGCDSLYYDKDTVILGVGCAQISGVGIYYYLYSYHLFSVLPLYTYSAGDTVYFFNRQSSLFEPYFFFNAVAGDTILAHEDFFGADSIIHAIVDSNGIMMVNSTPLRYYYYRPLDSCFGGPWQPIKVVERLGTMQGYLQPQWRCITEDTYYNLKCYQDDSLVLFQASNLSCSCIVMDIEEGNADLAFELFPNPTKDRVRYIISVPSKGEEVCIYNIMGCLTMKSYVNLSAGYLDVSNLERGTYLVELRSDGRVARRKLFIQ